MAPRNLMLSLFLAGSVWAAPAGSVPPQLPPSLSFGLGLTSPNDGWVKDARTKGAIFWTSYRYLVMDASGGWATNWCSTCARDGRFAKKFLDDAALAGVVGTFTFYEILGLPPEGNESAAYSKAQNITTMRRYFEDFRLLMQVCKTVAPKPVIVHLEPDGYAQIQIAAASNPNAPAAVASTGLAELAGLPNTLAGWGQAFGRIRAAVGANNVVLAPHYSTWSSGVDLMRGSGLTADINTHVNLTANFLNALGTYDMVAVEWLDRDAQTRGIWWDASDGASLTSLSFNRDLAVFTALNRATGKRLLLWQVPHGTTWSAIKSHHAEYVFGPQGASHRAKMLEAGVVSVLFGAGATGQTTHLNGTGADGGLYLRGEVAKFQKPAPDAGTPDAGTPLPPVDAGTPVVDAGVPHPPDAGAFVPCRCLLGTSSFSCRCP